MTLSIEDMSIFCKKKGIIYRSSDIYGGLSGFWDYGPVGVELFNNIKQSFWKWFVQSREDIVGQDASIISHPKTWVASGHVECFGDVLVEDLKTKKRYRADHLIEEQLNIVADGLSPEDMWKLIQENGITSPDGNELSEPKTFNLMFPTNVGSIQDSSTKVYLRGETAQAMFMNFRLIADTCRMQLPFGVAQVGRCFRNEISPRDFLFRSREFHIAELEYFIHPEETKCEQLTKKHFNLKLRVLTEKAQESDAKELVSLTIKEMLDKKMLGEWHAYFLAEQYLWLVNLGVDAEKLKIREHTKNELSHYSSATFDIDFEFPFGSKEIAGNANRGQYDLKQHITHSKQKLELFDEASKQKVVPRVIEPTFGMERVLLAVLYSAYNDDKERGNIVLDLAPKLAPVQVGVFPLVNKIKNDARELYDELRHEFVCQFDSSGSVGRRYARADELGVPYCVTFDFESLEDKSVTIRDRVSTEQKRVKISELKSELARLLAGGSFSN